MKVGIVWASSDRGNRNLYTQRDIPFKELLRLWEALGVIFYSLQVAAPEGDAGNQPDALPLIDLGRELSDFVDTPAVMTHLDLIITVDTSVAHLAGAMGLPVFLMPPFTPDWKWMFDRENNFWYPTMRLFRQPSPGAWSSVLAGIKHSLESMAARWNPA